MRLRNTARPRHFARARSQQTRHRFVSALLQTYARLAYKQLLPAYRDKLVHNVAHYNRTKPKSVNWIEKKADGANEDKLKSKYIRKNANAQLLSPCRAHER